MKQPPTDTTYCSECNEPCEGTFVDFGIGSYEFHGQRGNDVNIQYVSPCCEAEVRLNGQEYVPEDPRDEYDPAEDHERW